MKIRKHFFAAFFVLYSLTLFAGGFQINEHGSRAMAMGGAFTAVSFDPSAIYFNNAAITGLMGAHFMVGTTVIAPSASFRGPYGPGVSNPTIAESKLESQLFTPSHAYFTYQITNDLFCGIGFNNPFGLGTKWDDKWVGRFVSVEADVKTFSFTPVIAYKLMDNLSLGVGFQYNFGMVTLKKAVAFPPFAGEAMVNLEGDDMSAFGYSAGLLFAPMKDLSLGLSYRSEVEYNFEGTATTENGPAALAGSLPKGAIKATLKSPQQFTAGIAYTLCPEWTVTADYQYIAWSSYDSLKVEFVDSKTASSAPREYENTYILRFGTQYKLGSDLDLMAGFLYDNNPVDDTRVDPSLPDSDRLGFSAGFSYHLTNNMSLDASYLYLRFAERTVTNSLVNYTPSGVSPLNGTYNSTANLFSLSFSYNF